MGLFAGVWLGKWVGEVRFKLQVKSMLVSIDRLQRGCVKKLIGMNHRSSCGESILKRIAHEARHQVD